MKINVRKAHQVLVLYNPRALHMMCIMRIHLHIHIDLLGLPATAVERKICSLETSSAPETKVRAVSRSALQISTKRCGGCLEIKCIFESTIERPDMYRHMVCRFQKKRERVTAVKDAQLTFQLHFMPKDNTRPKQVKYVLVFEFMYVNVTTDREAQWYR